MRRSNHADVLLDKACVSKRSVREYRQDGKAAAAVIRDEHELSQRIDAQVRGAGALRAHHIEDRQIAGCAVDRQCSDRTGGRAVEVGNLVDRVEVAAVRVDREPGRIADRGSDLDLRQISRAGVEAEKADSLRIRRIGAHVGEDRPGWRRLHEGCHGCDCQRSRGLQNGAARDLANCEIAPGFGVWLLHGFSSPWIVHAWGTRCAKHESAKPEAEQSRRYPFRGAERPKEMSKFECGLLSRACEYHPMATLGG